MDNDHGQQEQITPQDDDLLKRFEYKSKVKPDEIFSEVDRPCLLPEDQPRNYSLSPTPRQSAASRTTIIGIVVFFTIALLISLLRGYTQGPMSHEEVEARQGYFPR